MAKNFLRKRSFARDVRKDTLFSSGDANLDLVAYYESKQVNKASPGPSKVSESMVINGAEGVYSTTWKGIDKY